MEIPGNYIVSFIKLLASFLFDPVISFALQNVVFRIAKKITHFELTN